MVILLKKPGDTPPQSRTEAEVLQWVAQDQSDFQTGLNKFPEANDSFKAFVNAPVLSRFQEDGGQKLFLQAFGSFHGKRQDIIRSKLSSFMKLFGGSTSGEAIERDLSRWKKQLDTIDLSAYSAYQEIQETLKNGEKVFSTLATLEALLTSDNLSGTYMEVYQKLLNYLVFSNEGFSSNSTEVETLLSPADFLRETVGAGRVPLDPGADLKFYTMFDVRQGKNLLSRGVVYRHGAMGHIIQWIIVALNQQGTHYQGRVAKLYSLTAQIISQDRKETTHLSLWSTLVDLPPIQGIWLDATMPEGITVLVNQFFPKINALEDAITSAYIAKLGSKGEKVYRTEGVAKA